VMGPVGTEATMRYLCLLVGEPDVAGPVPSTPEFMQMLSDYESATRAMAADGVLVDSGPLQPPSSATTLTGGPSTNQLDTRCRKARRRPRAAARSGRR
jgi:hypothetical protein